MGEKTLIERLRAWADNAVQLKYRSVSAVLLEAADALSQRDARIAELEAHLTFIGRVARSDGDRTFDRCIMDLGYIDDRCRTSRLSGQDGEG